eukprot:gene27908-46395_t
MPLPSPTRPDLSPQGQANSPFNQFVLSPGGRASPAFKGSPQGQFALSPFGEHATTPSFKLSP